MTTRLLAATAARHWGAVAKGTLVGTTLVAGSSLLETNSGDCSGKSECEATQTTIPSGKAKFLGSPVSLKTRMTSIGRFSLESETATNPSIPVFFVAMVGKSPLDSNKFIQLWNQRNMGERHPRFHSRVSPHSRGYFEPMEDHVEAHIQDTLPPMLYRKDLKHRIQSCLTNPISVWDSLWQIQISSGGTLGSSGAISRAKADRIRCRSEHSGDDGNMVESVLLFRGHHALADGVSLSTAFSDLCDEAEELRGLIRDEMKRRKGAFQSKTFWERLGLLLKRLVWFFQGSVLAMAHQLYLVCVTARSPFEEVRQRLPPSNNKDEEVGAQRTLSWCDAAPLRQVRQVARAMGPNVTVNDVWVSCITYAVARQLEEHDKHHSAVMANNYINNKVQTTKKRRNHHHRINVAIPVHLRGGVMLPGESVGNRIGAFVAHVPGRMDGLSSTERLWQVHESLAWIKKTPAPFLSYGMAKLALWLPSRRMTKWLFASSNANACVAITNTKGAPHKLHMDGRTIESVAGFLPLPPGIPIGCAVQSYAGVVSLSVVAEPWAVPDADAFLGWALEEYQRLVEQSGSVGDGKD